MSITDLDDPRTWPQAATIGAPFDAAEQGMAAGTQGEADACDARVRQWLADVLSSGEGDRLARTLAAASSPALARHVRRLLADVERNLGSPRDALGATLFAIPVIVVAAQNAEAQAVTIDAVLRDADAIASLLRDTRALGGSQTFALGNALVAADALDADRLPALLARAALHEGALAREALDLAPAPITVDGTQERVHLRFLPGVVLTPPGVDPLAADGIARFGMSLSQALGRSLAARDVTLLALPRAPQRLVIAVQGGRAAQREASAQLFASNAIRRIRASWGEPTAIVSAHRAADAPGGGELRLSLSSPFAARAAEGFRCPMQPYETVQEVAAMLETLLRDCRVADVRCMPGVHDDIDPITGGPLFFKDHGTLH